MIGQKLLTVLQSLDSTEFKKMKKAFESPYFATNARLLVLYSYLRKLHPDFDEKHLQKEKLFEKLYPGKPFNGGLLRVLVREFSMVVEDFMMMERLRNDKHRRKKMLVSEYGQRNLYEYFRKGTFELMEKEEGTFVPDMEYFMERVELCQAYSFHPMTDNYDKKDNTLEVLMDSLDAYFIMAKLRFKQVLKNSNTVFAKEMKIRFSEILGKQEEFDLIKNNSLVKIYNYIDSLFEKGDREIYKEIKNEFFPIIAKMSKTDRRIVFFILLNFCVRQASGGDAEFYYELFELYNRGLSNEVLLENNTMSEETFNNIITVSCFVKEFDWVDGFIGKYKIYLDPHIREEAITYSVGYLYFQKGDFDNAIYTFSNYTFSTKNQLDVRRNLIRAIFEKSLVDRSFFFMLKPQISSFKKYLQRDKYSSERRVRYHEDFLKIINGFSKRLWDNDDRSKIKLWALKEMGKNPRMASKSWLLDKIKNLE